MSGLTLSLFPLSPMALLFTLLTSSDAITSIPPTSPFAMQTLLMEIFIRDITPSFRDTIRKGSPDDVCKWVGVTCLNKLLTRIFFSGQRVGNFRLGALPPTTTDIEILDCQQKYEIDVRSLPRDLERFYMARNMIHGTLDISGLPRKLHNISFRDNAITGPIELVNLPPELRTLHLSGNRIYQEIVWYDNIPTTCHTIGLMQANDTNHIKAIEAVERERKVSSHIFKTGRENIVDKKSDGFFS